MNDVLRMGRKAFTLSVAVATIAWSIGLAALLLPLTAGAAALTSGALIKASLPAVYYYGADGKRYVFPNEKTYKTWYADFSGVQKVTDAELAAIAIGGNATYKPGAKMVKITTDPKVYAVAKGGTLRWVNSEQVAANLYGANWNQQIEDVPDAFFVNYKLGSDVAATADFDKAGELAAATSINVDKGLATTTGGTGALTVAAASDTPAAGDLVVDSDTTAEDSGQQRAAMLKVNLTAGAAEVKVSGLKFKRGGISKDGDLDNVLLMDGETILAESVSVSSAVATFSSLGLTVAANSSKALTLAINLNKGTTNGSTMNWSLASADVTSDAASATGSALGNTMRVTAVSDLGQLEVAQTNTAPANVDPGTTAKELWRFSFAAEGQDMLLTYVKLTQLGSVSDSDLQNLKLMDSATQLNGTVAQVKDKVVEFDLSTMSGGGYKILAGQSKQLTLNADVVGGTDRTIRFSVQKQENVRAKDLQYNVWAFVDDYDATDDDAFGVISSGSAATTINTGTLAVSVASDSPSTNVPVSGTGVTLAKLNFKASGEDVKVTDLTVICWGSTTTRYLKNTKVLLDGVQVGSTDANALCDSSTDEAAYTFGNTLVLTSGKTHVISLVADLNGAAGASVGGQTTTAWAAADTMYVGFGGTGAAQGKVSLTTLTPTNVNGRTLTLRTGTVTVIKDQSFSDRSSTSPSGVSNADNIKLGSFVVVGGSGEAVDISQFVLRDNETANHQIGDNFQNLVLKKRDGTQIDKTIASLNTAEGTYTFTPAASIRLAAGAQMALDVFADVKGSPETTGSNRNAIEVDTISATGVLTSASANFGTAGNDATDVALQTIYIAANGALTVDEGADTPVAQQMVLGATGLEMAKFKLSAAAAESITVTQFVVADDMSTGGSSRRGATGTLLNFKLYNGATLLASVASLDATDNTTSPNAIFTGFTLTVPKNQNVTLTVKADLTSYDDGGMPSSSHRLFVPTDYKLSEINDQEPITAVGAGSGFSISSTALDLNGGTATGDTDRNVVGSYMDAVRAKLTLAHAADAPSGAAVASAEQTVAKFVATNSANVGSYALTIKNLNLQVGSAGHSLVSTSQLKVYKDSVSTANQLASSNYCNGTSCGSQTFVDSTFAAGDFTDVEVAAGSSKTVLVTLQTSNSGFGSADTLSVGIAVANDIQWTDGNSNNDDYYTVDSLPLAGKTLVY